MSTFSQLRRALLTALVLSGLGCASSPYPYGDGWESPSTLPLGLDEPQIERGRPHAGLDALGNVFSLPAKLLLLSWRVENHNISDETEHALRQYLAANGLSSVKVRLNQYDPEGEWARLFANRDVAAGWRYTLGALTVAAYTVFPQRVFGGDHYNPFTNTIHLYSDARAIALHEAGHAKDFQSRRGKGAYAALRLLPLLPLYQEAVATGDAIGYERELDNIDGERGAYKLLYPAYGTYLGGEIVRWIPLGSTSLAYAIQYGAVLPLHVVGRVRAWRVQSGEEPE